MQNQENFVFKNQTFRFASDSDIPKIRLLVNSAYKELSEMGLNYTATYQDEQTTRNRMSGGRAFLLEKDNELAGTVLLTNKNYFTNKNSAYVSQLAVVPSLKKQGLGSLLMDLCEDLARQEGYDSVQLDTAKPAGHLVEWYLKRGYKIVGETKWEGKTYESWIFEKTFI
jgi:predicted N-acetyltransferase YhbS